MPARYWNPNADSGDVRPVFAAIFSALRERASHRSLPLARARGPVADHAQGANVKLGPIDPDPDRLHGHTVLHDTERTIVLVPCENGCGRLKAFPEHEADIMWMCRACWRLPPERAGGIGGAHPTLIGGSCV